MLRNSLNLAASAGLTALLWLLGGSSAALAATAPPLGVAASFAVLGASAVSNTGATIVTGDLGIWPGTAGAITGFPPGSVTGTIQAGNAVAQQAQSDLTAAYNNLAGQPLTTDLTGTDLGGLTLTPGVYRFSSSAQLTGTLTLDAQGNPGAVFVFQIGSTLITAANARVLVINSGSNCNVFWQVGSSATLGAATGFAGNILALVSITLNTGATVTGRVLARNGAVTMDTNGVAVCAAACPVITLAPATLPNGTGGTAYSQALTASGGTAPYGYSVIAGSLPPGLTLSAAGLLSGTPTALGTYTFTVRATDSTGCTGTEIYTIVINAPVCPIITLSPASLPAAPTGTPYNQTITASGGTAPYTFSLTAGALPPGLTFNSASGLLSGTPTTTGTFTFTVLATDTAGCTGSQVYVIVINVPACPAITLLPSSLSAAVAGAAYSQPITASGGIAPYAYTVASGSLPPGLILNSATGVLSGTPTTPGSYTFTVRATDSAGCIGSQVYTIVINAPPCPVITLSPASLAAAPTGTPYNQSITASGGTAPYTFSLTAGALPPGLTLNSASGLLSGTPTTTGTFTFTVTATDSAGCTGSRVYVIVINLPSCPAIALSPVGLSAAAAGAAYSQTIVASGGTAPYTFSLAAGALPAGLTLSAAGVLSGIPTTPGSYTFTVRATDSAGCIGSQVYTIVINAPVCPVITLSPLSLPAAASGTAYSQAITASGGTGPYTFSLTAGALPPGLALSAAGVLSGTPTTPGGYTFTVTGTDSGGCAGSRVYVIVINAPICPAITLSPLSLSPAAAGAAYSQAITASGGTAPYAYSVASGALPPGLTLSASGVLSGTPTAPGTYTFTVRATDFAGCIGSQVYTIVINAPACPAITLSPLTLPVAAVGAPYSQAITASGGTAPYTFSLTAGALPPGLALSAAGVLSGTPTTPGSYTFTVTATDAASCVGSRIYSIPVPVASTAIPTLSEWSLMLLAGLVALTGILTSRKSGRRGC